MPSLEGGVGKRAYRKIELRALLLPYTDSQLGLELLYLVALSQLRYAAHLDERVDVYFPTLRGLK